MTGDLKELDPLFVAVLNGSFIFAADLLRELPFSPQLAFIKVASYQGMSSSGRVELISDLTESVDGRNLVLLEDVVDSGLTVAFLKELFVSRGAKSVKVAALLFKPDALKTGTAPEYAAFEIRNEFVIGYGLDYDGIGRNLKEIHILAENN